METEYLPKSRSRKTVWLDKVVVAVAGYVIQCLGTVVERPTEWGSALSYR